MPSMTKHAASPMGRQHNNRRVGTNLLIVGMREMPSSVPTVLQIKNDPRLRPEKSKTVSMIDRRPAQVAKDNPARRNIRLMLVRSVIRCRARWATSWAIRNYPFRFLQFLEFISKYRDKLLFSRNSIRLCAVAPLVIMRFTESKACTGPRERFSRSNLRQSGASGRGI